MRTTQPHWSNTSCAWRAVPEEERQLATQKMLDRCGTLLQARGNDVASSAVQAAIDARLYQARRTWIRNQQKASRAQPDLTKAAGTPEHDIGNSASSTRNVMDINSVLDSSQ